MKQVTRTMLLVGLSWGLLSNFASAALIYDQEVSNEVIFGSGNLNGGFTVDRQNGIELGLRAKLRFDETNSPQNVFNSDGAGSYQFDNILPPSGFGFAPGSTSTAIWNFEWSVNSSFDGSGGMLSDYTYLLQIDFDPSAATHFLVFDPVNVSNADHALGNNATANGAGLVDSVNYAALLDDYNLVQNSWNMEFFDDATYSFDARVAGTYDIRLSAYDQQGRELASSAIQVVNAAVPEPQTWLSFALAMFSLLWMRRRQA
ncbi:PEP-CTERM sorting domain-containing protein [Agarivorans sp.]|uniref:PEP-CTERM sorting domain-containing protein n=1 Tax=Agarivorans sp. TaxID=1872412 RepID=UPI003D020AD9